MDQTNVRTGNDAVAGLQRESASLRAAAELKSSAAADLKAASEAQQAVAEASASLVEQVSAGVESLDDVKRRLKAFQERVAIESDDLYRAVEEQQKRISELQALIVDGVSEKLSPRMRDMLQARAEKDEPSAGREAAEAAKAHDVAPSREKVDAREDEASSIDKDPERVEENEQGLVGAKPDLSKVPYDELLAEFAKRQAAAEARQEKEDTPAPEREEAAETEGGREEKDDEPDPTRHPSAPEAVSEAEVTDGGDLDGLGDLDEPETDVDAGTGDDADHGGPHEAATRGGEAPGLADEDGAFGPAPLNTGTGTWQPSGGFGGAAFRADWAEQEAQEGSQADTPAEGGIEHVDRRDLKPDVRKQFDVRGY